MIPFNNIFKKLLKNQVKFNFNKALPTNSSIIQSKDININSLKNNFNNHNNSNNNNNDKSLVVVLGWLDGKEKNVNKYSSDWNDRGYNTLTNYYPFFDILLPAIHTPKSLLLLDKINEIIKENPNIDKIIFHVLSNGGAFYYSRIINFIENYEEYKHLHKFIKGSLLDSNPSTDKDGVKYAFSISSPNQLIKNILLKLFPIIYYMISRDFKYFKSIYSNKNNWNHLFIYCKNDKLINYKHVDETIFNLKSNIKDDKLIDHVCFDESNHVFHRNIHKDVYFNKFNNFINKIENL